MPFDKNKLYKCKLCDGYIEKKSIQRYSRPLACEPCREKAIEEMPKTEEEKKQFNKMLEDLEKEYGRLF